MGLRRKLQAGRPGDRPADLVVVGLGNPGATYVGTLHNIGAEVVELLAERHGGRLRHSKQLADTAQMLVGTKRLAVAVPHTFMNESGLAVRRLVDRYGIDDLARLVIVHDELDLDPGRLKVKFGGGLAGHNGLRSIKALLGSAEFSRVRIGVGKPPSKGAGADHVLRRPARRVREELDQSREMAADAVECILADGLDAAMNRFNR